MYINKNINVFLLGWLLLGNSGCSTLMTKTETFSPQKKEERVLQVGCLYSGTKQAVRGWGEVIYYSLMAFPPLVLITIPASAVDMTGSMILDSLWIPFDIAHKVSNTTMTNNQNKGDYCL